MKRRDFSLAALASLTAAQFPFSIANAQQLGAVKMMIPANPGGGWDQTGRALATAMQSAKTAQTVQFENKGGAAGTIGLAQFVNSAKGMLLGEDVKNSSQIGVINDFDRVYVQTGTFSFEEGSFREHVLRINKNEPTEAFALQYFQEATLFLEGIKSLRSQQVA